MAKLRRFCSGRPARRRSMSALRRGMARDPQGLRGVNPKFSGGERAPCCPLPVVAASTSQMQKNAATRKRDGTRPASRRRSRAGCSIGWHRLLVFAHPAPPVSRSACYGRASRIILKGVSAARRILEKPPLWITSRSFFSPACAPSAAPTSCDREVGRQIMVEPA